MNPTADAPQQTTEIVFLRFQQPFFQTIGNLFGLPDTWLLIPLVLLLVLAACLTLFTVARARRRVAEVRAGRAPRLDPLGGWLKFITGTLWFLFVVCLLVALFRNDTFSTSSSSVAIGSGVSAQSDALLWSLLTGGVFVLGAAFAIAMYMRDAKSVRWYWATGLAVLRIGVYALLCIAFLLPAEQTFDKSEKRSRVVVLLDITPSLTAKSDDVGGPIGKKPKTRIATVIEFLSDDKVAFLKKLLEKNPVVVYRFGNRLDDDPQSFGKGDAAWSAEEWQAFIHYDFRPFLLKGVSPQGQEILRTTEGWDAEKPGTADWAAAWAFHWNQKYPKVEGKPLPAPNGMSPADAETVHTNVAKLEARISVARSIIQGTNVPDSVSAAVNRETGNMVQGIIVISDGRSNLGSGTGTGYRELRAKAAKDKVPLITIAVGEDREVAAITITGIQAPETAPPNEPFKLIVEADGVNLANQPAEVFLDLFLPGKDPKTDAPDATLTQKLPFAPGDPPHLQAEFVIDPDKLPEALVEPAKDTATGKNVLKQGSWSVRARIPRDNREATADAEHVFERSKILVQQKPLKVLLVTSTPSREYQALRTLLVREAQEKRAELCILLQGPLENVTPDLADPKETKRKQKAALKGIVQDVDEDRLLVRFPDRLEVGNVKIDRTGDWEAGDPDYKFYNINEYDLIIALDADWEKISPENAPHVAKNLREWVQRQGGGLILVAGPLKTHQLARVEAEAGGKNSQLLPILDVLPVIPDDLVELKTRPFPKDQRRLYLYPPTGSDILRLDVATGIHFAPDSPGQAPTIASVEPRSPAWPVPPDQKPDSSQAKLKSGDRIAFIDDGTTKEPRPITSSKAFNDYLDSRMLPGSGLKLKLGVQRDGSLIWVEFPLSYEPTAGWENYFTDRTTYARLEDPLKEVAPRRGFYSVYPVKTRKSPNPRLAEIYEVKNDPDKPEEMGLKTKATLLAAMATPDDKGNIVREPWLVTLDPVGGRGRSAYLASGEIYRMVGYEKDYYDRFWMKLIKFMVGTRNFKTARGRVLLDKEYVVGAPIRIQAQLLNTKSLPYAITDAPPKFKIVQISPSGQLVDVGLYQMTPRKSGNEFDGYYTGQVHADPKQFQTGEFRYRVVIEVPESAGDTIEGEFKVRPSDPEMDNTRPDLGALLALASDLDKDFEARIGGGSEKQTDEAKRRAEDVKKKLREQLPKLDGATKLAFRINQPELLELIPECMTAQEKTDKVLGKTDDLWDRGFAVPESWTSWLFNGPQKLSYLLLIVVGLLSIEWLTRKLLRLA